LIKNYYIPASSTKTLINNILSRFFLLKLVLFYPYFNLLLPQMAGIYIHIPFCKQKCTYCDFHFSTTYHSYRKEMILSILKEIESRKNELSSVETIYFGGGTPSLLDKDELDSIIQTIQANYTINESLEITLEANPDDISTNKLKEWKKAGINRLSIGLQSFKSFDLEWMNRAHTVEEAGNCISIAQQEGFHNLTVDLIYGLPELTLVEWENHIQKLIDLKVSHISAYCLTIEKQTVLSSWIKKGKIEPAKEEMQSLQFELLVNILQKNGYEQYEISNFCLPDRESKHNSSYWKGTHYIGVGPSAHSYNGKERRWNIANNQLYIKKMKQGEDYFEKETLSSIDQFNELLLTGLRTKYGVSLLKLASFTQISTEFQYKVNEFKEKKWMLEGNNSLYLTQEGKLMADHIASELFIV